jgi:hypothetical protein
LLGIVAPVLITATLFGGGAPGPAPIRHVRSADPPRVICLDVSVDRTAVAEGEWVRLTADGIATTFEPVSYAWSASAGNIVTPALFGDHTAVFDTSGLEPGTYMVSASVGGPLLFGVPSTPCSVDIAVRPRPLGGALQLRSDRAFVRLGEIVTLRATVTDARSGVDPRRLTWSSTSGGLDVHENVAFLDTTSTDAEIAVTVTDPETKASDSLRIGVQSGPVCGLPVLFDTWFEPNETALNESIRSGLDGAVRLVEGAEPDTVLVVSGLGQSDERPNAGDRRAEAARRYLERRWPAMASRIVVRSFAPLPAAPADARPNRRLAVGFTRREVLERGLAAERGR